MRSLLLVVQPASASCRSVGRPDKPAFWIRFRVFWNRFLLYFTFVVNVLIWFYDLCGMLYCPMPPQANKINRSVYTSIRPSSTRSKDHFTMSTRWLRAFLTPGTLPNDVFPFARMNVSSVDVCVCVFEVL